MNPESPSLGKSEKLPNPLTGKLAGRIFARNTPAEYLPLVEGVRLITAKSAYSEHLFKILNQDRYQKLLHAKIQNGIVVDLGCGTASRFQHLAEMLHANIYIGIDLEPVTGASSGPTPQRSLKLLIEEKETAPIETYSESGQLQTKQPQIVEYTAGEASKCSIKIAGDMLDTISRFDDASVDVVSLIGIEGADVGTNREYQRALKTEMLRILKKDGIIIAYESDFNPDNIRTLMSFENEDRLKGAIYSKN